MHVLHYPFDILKTLKILCLATAISKIAPEMAFFKRLPLIHLGKIKLNSTLVVRTRPCYQHLHPEKGSYYRQFYKWGCKIVLPGQTVNVNSILYSFTFRHFGKNFLKTFPDSFPPVPTTEENQLKLNEP